MKVTYVDHMGTDLSVVNAARVSFNKVSEVFDNKDEKLINYLAKHNHWTPFAHNAVTLHIKAPLFVARQLGKHQVGFVWNEVSRRYVTDEPEFYEPDGWRKATENVKQGSSDEVVDLSGEYIWCDDNKPNYGWDDYTLEELYHEHLDREYLLYNKMVERNVCPEQARMVLPQSMYTEWYWTGNLYAFFNVWKERTHPHAQKEVQDVAHQIEKVIQPLFPVSWEALKNNK